MNFSKMHGLGNDFMVIDAVTQNVHLSSEMIKRMSDRYTGIGFDQLLIVEPPYSPETYIIRSQEQTVLCGVASMGNPHCVIQVEDVLTAQVLTLGPLLEQHERFPEKANIGFMHIIDRDNINLRVYERGVGETQACGTGACAAVAVGINQGLLNQRVNVNLPGGKLIIDWKGNQSPLYMTGPATHVYDGYIAI